MDTPDTQLYARSFADVYDTWYGDLDDPSDLVASMQRRCRPNGTVVELGSGTGRLASPLHHAGFRVIAVDISAPMLLAAEPGPHRAVADMTEIPVRSTGADAVLVAYNTLFNVADVGLQHRCFQEAARVLRPSGVLAIEAFVAPSDGADGDGPAAFGISSRPHPTDPDSTLSIVTGPHATSTGVIVGAHVETGAQIVCRPWQLTYQSPTELDASAADAGLVLEARFGDWSNAEFAPDAARHVSWYTMSSSTKSRESDLR